MRTAAFMLAAVLALAGAACEQIDLPATVEPVDVVTGWFDDGIVAGKNRLLPSITLKLRNRSSDTTLRNVQILAVFRRVNETETWGDHFGWAVHGDPLMPGATSPEIVMRSTFGYTSELPRLQILQSSFFIDAVAAILLKTGRQNWTRIGEFPVRRQLLTR